MSFLWLCQKLTPLHHAFSPHLRERQPHNSDDVKKQDPLRTANSKLFQGRSRGSDGSGTLAQSWEDCKCSCVGSRNHLGFSVDCARWNSMSFTGACVVGIQRGECLAQSLLSVWYKLSSSAPEQREDVGEPQLPLIWGWCDFMCNASCTKPSKKSFCS